MLGTAATTTDASHQAGLTRLVARPIEIFGQLNGQSFLKGRAATLAGERLPNAEFPLALGLIKPGRGNA